MRLIPTSNYVLLEEQKTAEQHSDGGIVLPRGIELKSYSIAKVLAIGPEVNRLGDRTMGPDVVKVGSRAVYAKDDTAPLEIDGKLYRVIVAQRICATIHGEAE